MYFTQKRRIKGAKSFSDLQEIAGDPKMSWTDELNTLFFIQADKIITTTDEVCQLAISCSEPLLKNSILLHFAKKLGIGDLDTLREYLNALNNSAKDTATFRKLLKMLRESDYAENLLNKFGPFRKSLKEALENDRQTQTEIINASTQALSIPEGAGLEKIGEIAKISTELIPGTKERLLLEEATTDAVLLYLYSCVDARNYAEKFLRGNVSGISTLITAYAQEKLDSLSDAVYLMGMTIVPSEMMTDDVSAIIKSTRMEIYQTALGLLGENRSVVSIPQLKSFAEMIVPLSDDGSDTEEVENRFNSFVLKGDIDSSLAVEMADAFGTKSGRHRFLSAYLDSLGEKPFTQDDLDKITVALQTISFGGAKVYVKLYMLANQKGLMFNETEALLKMSTPFTETGDLMGYFSKQSSGKCQCIDCQIGRLITNDPKNSYLFGEWQDAKLKLAEEGVFRVLGERAYGVVGNKELFEKAINKHGISLILREILYKAFYQEYVAKAISNENEFRQILEDIYQKGKLATYKFNTNAGFLTVKEITELPSDDGNRKIDSALMRVAMEYASKIY